MNKFDIGVYTLFILSIIGIGYALIFNPVYWITYALAIVCIPFAILSFGFIAMARGKKDEEEEKRKEPFIGY